MEERGQEKFLYSPKRLDREGDIVGQVKLFSLFRLIKQRLFVKFVFDIFLALLSCEKFVNLKTEKLGQVEDF